MAESPEEKEALEKLDEETREVADDELQKEADRELSTAFNPRFGVPVPGPLAWVGRLRPFRWKQGDPLPERADGVDPDPVDEHGLREALHEDDAKS